MPTRIDESVEEPSAQAGAMMPGRTFNGSAGSRRYRRGMNRLSSGGAGPFSRVLRSDNATNGHVPSRYYRLLDLRYWIAAALIGALAWAAFFALI